MESHPVNPYAAPQRGESLVAIAEATGNPSAMQVFWGWERLRLYYNGVLVLLSLLVVNVRVLEFLPDLIAGAVGVNICFCVGPVAEGYLVAVGLPRRLVRWTLFLLGTGVSMFGCAIATLFMVTPPFAFE